MAITGVTYRLLKEHAHLLKRGGSLLEIGEANWYGDMLPSDLTIDLVNHIGGIVGRDIREALETGNPFAVAKAIYRALFSPTRHDAIDLHGTDIAWKFDLNVPLNHWLPNEYDELAYDVVINNGTSEHIFNVAQVFETMHDACVVGGVMIHDAPFTGWVDHGFYTLQPTLFYDLAAANEYELVSLSITHIESGTIIRVESREHFHTLREVPQNALLFVVMRKVNDKQFRIPMQGLYDGERISKAGVQAWHERR